VNVLLETIFPIAFVFIILALVGIALYYGRNQLRQHWRGILARLPLPMLAIPASYGVYEFTALFVPTWVAIMQAAAFETVYVGLAAYDKLTNQDKWRALGISIFAVGASVIYNTLAGYFHRSPQALISWESVWWGGLILAALHGVPLALLAFFVSNFTLHRSPMEASHAEETKTDPTSGESNSLQVAPQGTFKRKRKTRSIFIRVEKPTSPPDPKTLPPPTQDTIPILIAAGLTEGQIEALRLKRAGLTNEQIGTRLGISAQGASSRITTATKTAPKAVKAYLAK
jgi:predicted DNA-binding protein (UPF0251 family)